MVSATVFIQINDLSFHINETYIHASVPGIARYTLSGYILDAVSIMLVMMNNEPNHFIAFTMSFSPVLFLPYLP